MSIPELSTNLHMEALKEALLFAYRDPADFDMLLGLKLGRSFHEMAPLYGNYEQAIYAVLVKARAEGWLEDLYQAAISAKPKSPKLLLLKRAARLSRIDDEGGQPLEDIIRHNAGFTDILPWIAKLEQIAGAVCRIEIPINQAAGTGFLVGPDLVVTNCHVVCSVLSGERKSADISCRFDYAVELDQTRKGVEYALHTDWCLDFSPAAALELGAGAAEATEDELDYAILRLAENVASTLNAAGQPRGFIKPEAGIPQSGDVLVVVQHPAGDPLKLTLGEAIGYNGNGTRIMHNANTVHGSSGSPVFDARLGLVAIHNCGDPIYGGQIGTPTSNRSIPIGAIFHRWQTKKGKA